MMKKCQCGIHKKNLNIKVRVQMKIKRMLGESVAETIMITEEQIDAFAKITGDYNSIHMDREFAKTQRFTGRVAHGLYVNSLVSTVMGMKLPGPGTVLMDQTITFSSPVIEGDTITICITLAKVDERYKNYIATMNIECKNQRDQVVLHGTCRQLMSKSIFEIGGIHND